MPSAWPDSHSTRMASDSDGHGGRSEATRGIGGDVHDSTAWRNYPESNASDNVMHDPVEAWNALTVARAPTWSRLAVPDTRGLAPIAVRGVSLCPSVAPHPFNWEKH